MSLEGVDFFSQGFCTQGLRRKIFCSVFRDGLGVRIAAVIRKNGVRDQAGDHMENDKSDEVAIHYGLYLPAQLPTRTIILRGLAGRVNGRKG